MPRTTTQDKVFAITPIYDILLRGSEITPVGLYHLQIATADQLCRLHYSKGSIKTIKARLKDLVTYGYIQYDAIPTKFTRSPYYYALDRRALDYLEEAGYDIKAYFRPSKEINKSSLFIQHTLEINDVLIAAALLRKADSRYHLAGFLHERTMKQTPYTARYQRPAGNKVKDEITTLIPDGFFDFRLTTPEGKQRRRPVLLEHDRGTEEQKYFKRKIRAYIVFLKAQAYKDLFHTSTITIIFTTFAGAHRLEEMREWTRQECNATNEPAGVVTSFLFTTLPPALEPGMLFLSPVWHYATDTKPVSLLAD
jgi:hypothetical protein